MIKASVANQDSLKRLEALFFEALEQPPNQRDAFLEWACHGDDTLKSSLRLMLRADVDSSRTIETAPWAVGQIGSRLATSPECDPQLQPGAQIGRYQLERVLGAGGMGTVWLARRSDGAFDKNVALKLIKRGLDTDDILKRFQHERQVLARLDHPNIARLVDGGAAADGRPYLVMEYVEGVPIDEWCDQRRSRISEKLRLFLTVCEAVQYAHSRLTVHRDLKPGNILVCRDGEVKLLDFGLAKLLQEADSRDSPSITTCGQRLLTPRYASPEQVHGLPVSTSSDVYSLGVILYELLTGRSPYADSISSRSALERAITSEVPARPSTVVRTTSRSGALNTGEASQLRGIAGRAAARMLRGDLDTIVMKALAKDPKRRYETAASLGDDVRRFLQRRPIAAAPDSIWYRARRFAARNRAAVAAAIGLLAILTMGIAATVWQAGVAMDERDRAAEARVQAAGEATRATQIKDFLASVLSSIDPEYARDMDKALLRKVLDDATARLGLDLPGQPTVQAELLIVVGSAYTSIGEFATARRLFDQSIGLSASQLGRDAPLTLEAMLRLGELHTELREFHEAEKLLQHVLAVRLATQGEGDEKTLDAVKAVGDLACELGRFEQAEVQLRRAHAGYEVILGRDHRKTLQSASSLGAALHEQGRLEESLALFQSIRDSQVRTLGADHPDSLTSLHWTGTLRMRMNEYSEAKLVLLEVLDGRRRVLGPEHPHTINVMFNLARVHDQQNEFAEAERLFIATNEGWRKKYGDDFPRTYMCLFELGRLQLRQGNTEPALANLHESELGFSRLYGADHERTRQVRQLRTSVAAGNQRGE